MSNPEKITNVLENIFSKLPTEFRDDFKRKLQEAIQYTPKIGVMGKSGAGKSSLINALVGQNACQTGAVGGCTRAFQEEKIALAGREIIFMDLPGIAESTTYDDEYKALYKSKVEDLDLILWVIKVDDRANVSDQQFYNDLVTYYKKERIIFVLSQSDKAEPSREFDYQYYIPSPKQLNIIDKNRVRIQESFNVDLDDIIPVACEFYEDKYSRWNFDKLVTRIIKKIPAKAKSSLYASVSKENRTEESAREAKNGFNMVVNGILDTIINSTPLKVIAPVLDKLKKPIIDGIESLWNKIFG
ncbi:GTP-binding protein [Pelistega sp. NLN82]|uniref:GTP-binding protein n=1 Tax=Pelistega ratti TaxID=2652177 RepID=A0A6L9Y432_9BURK|nr:GTPase [Pelistega ratti]NEN74986.1 GTP-binding protein [Pelistega ratti]